MLSIWVSVGGGVVTVIQMVPVSRVVFAPSIVVSGGDTECSKTANCEVTESRVSGSDHKLVTFV